MKKVVSLKNKKSIHARKSTDWHTFKEGDMVPDELVSIVENKGAVLVDTLKDETARYVPVEEPKASKEPEIKSELKSESELYELNKKEQVDLLKELGMISSEINKLKTESKRVEAILSLQEGSK